MLLPVCALALQIGQKPAASAPVLPVRIPYLWDAWLDGPGGRIEFKLSVEDVNGTLQFALLNGGKNVDVTPIERWERTPKGVALHIDSYDSHIEITKLDAHGALDGTWRKRRGADQWIEMPMHGVGSGEMVPDGAHFPMPHGPGTPPAIEGRWQVKFSSLDESSVGVFAMSFEDQVAGTFLTTLGDYRYLAGEHARADESWRLSCFDGAHAFLFSAKQLEDGTLSGDFWSGDKWHETWTAKRDDNAQLPDPFGLTKSNANVDLARLIFTTIDGAKISLADPKFAGKARILQLFGTWCPNCNDEAEYLRELDKRYRSKGLSIVGLGFELTGDAPRDLGQLKLFAARHKLEYPLLLAGKSDKAEASKAFPLLDQVRAFPTTIFLHADGRVRAVHQGYSGPAAGAEHQKLRDDFERLIAELLAEPKPATR